MYPVAVTGGAETESLRLAVDTGGTFTDLLIEMSGELRMAKTPTTPEDPVNGIMTGLEALAGELGLGIREMLSATESLMHGTTRAINALVTGTAARTAFLTTRGHPDVLLFREGGRSNPFDHAAPYPQPLVPRALTFEIPERIGAQGEIVEKLDETAVMQVIDSLKCARIDAVGVALLFSPVNATHEIRVGELLDEHLPNVPVTLSHRVNASLREFRRASSACLDASLKPLMTKYLAALKGRLRKAGFRGKLLIVSSQGGLLDADEAARTPIHTINSGPAMAPVSGRFFAGLEGEIEDVVICDTGGTTFDVSLVRGGHIPRTRETWIGPPYAGHMTGFPSTDVQSVGAGGGSIAHIEDGGLLAVGPQSAGAVPGPACYGRGGSRPTVTDAALVLGYLDDAFFLGGAMELDADAAHEAIEGQVADPLGLRVEEAAAAILRMATESMVHAIEEVTVNQGIDPRTAVLVGGGGAAGLNIVAIARRLGCQQILVPELAPALSSAGALYSDQVSETATTFFTRSDAFDFDGVRSVVRGLRTQCEQFADTVAPDASRSIEWFIEARYPHQAWELEVRVPTASIENDAELSTLVDAFHDTHRSVFAIADRAAPIEIVTWRARVVCAMAKPTGRLRSDLSGAHSPAKRRVWFADTGPCHADVISGQTIDEHTPVTGPAIIELPATTVVLDPESTCRASAAGTLVITP